MIKFDDIEEWRFHLGAHKTATSHLQLALRKRRGPLLNEDVSFLPPRFVRSLSVRATALRQERDAAPEARRDRQMRKRFRTLQNGPGLRRVMVVSDENLIGGCKDLLAPPFHPHAALILRRLMSLGGADVRVRLFLAVRSPDEIASAAFAQMLRSGKRTPAVEDLRERWSTPGRPWLDLVRRIAEVAPGALTLWRYDDYRDHAPAIAALLVGRDPGPIDAGGRPVRTATPTMAAVRAAIAEAEGRPKLERKKIIRRAYDGALPRDEGEKFQLFEADDRRRLRDAYEADLEAIRASGLCTVFDPGA